ncbi:MAG TPA: hypothetical protein VGD13_15845 [Xanthobacteraceae bacterium]|jgi:hypothetical protein
MRKLLIALGLAAGFVGGAADIAQAQFYFDYGERPRYRERYYHDERPRYRDRYYDERPRYRDRYYDVRPAYGRRYAPPSYDQGGWHRPMRARNGTLQCASPRHTVQDGICKPYRGY